MFSGTSKGLMRTKFATALCSFFRFLYSVVRKYRRSVGRVLLHSCGFRSIIALFEEQASKGLIARTWGRPRAGVWCASQGGSGRRSLPIRRLHGGQALYWSRVPSRALLACGRRTGVERG